MQGISLGTKSVVVVLLLQFANARPQNANLLPLDD